MPIPALSPQIPVASRPITEPDRIHQQLAAPQGLHASLTAKECPPGKVQIAACTRTSDTQCQCENGTYQDKDSPEYCLRCDTRCPNGKVKARDCGPNNNLECVDQKSGSGAATKSRSRGWFGCLRAPVEAEALDNVRNLAKSDRDSLSSEQEQEELAGGLVHPAGEAQLLLGPTGTDGSQMRRKLLVPANNENPIETLREFFYDFSRIVPFTRWEPFMRLVGLKENDIFMAKAQALDPRDALYHMLTIWLNTKGKAASVNTLLDSLDKLGETKAKEEMQDFLLESRKYVYEVGEAGSAVSQ
ncbi:Tumor necrosis factor receptor superfamily member 10A [Myotis brandtii]|uniref:Tumor necrosis factor receptor superfamily member 10A n=1 Tax=Myotis brandtii TaxID=109478 RepID=S7P902_MYOBR|nr:Tumor necrosis factor receptor superfamily member 10A [Myotis brandtii]